MQQSYYETIPGLFRWRILTRYPRDGFARDALIHVARGRKRNPGCRFACLHALFPIMLGRSSFTLDARPPGAR